MQFVKKLRSTPYIQDDWVTPRLEVTVAGRPWANTFGCNTHGFNAAIRTHAPQLWCANTDTLRLAHQLREATKHALS